MRLTPWCWKRTIIRFCPASLRRWPESLVTLVDSAGETARVVVSTLQTEGLLNTTASNGSLSFLVTDGHAHFREMGEQFLGHPLHSVEWVDVQDI